MKKIFMIAMALFSLNVMAPEKGHAALQDPKLDVCNGPCKEAACGKKGKIKECEDCVRKKTDMLDENVECSKCEMPCFHSKKANVCGSCIVKHCDMSNVSVCPALKPGEMEEIVIEEYEDPDTGEILPGKRSGLN